MGMWLLLYKAKGGEVPECVCVCACVRTCILHSWKHTEDAFKPLVLSLNVFYALVHNLLHHLYIVRCTVEEDRGRQTHTQGYITLYK